MAIHLRVEGASNCVAADCCVVGDDNSRTAEHKSGVVMDQIVVFASAIYLPAPTEPAQFGVFRVVADREGSWLTVLTGCVEEMVGTHLVMSDRMGAEYHVVFALTCPSCCVVYAVVVEDHVGDVGLGVDCLRVTDHVETCAEHLRQVLPIDCHREHAHCLIVSAIYCPGRVALDTARSGDGRDEGVGEIGSVVIA